MKQTRRKFTSGFKALVALEAIKNKKTFAELSRQFDVNAVLISKWKTECLENLGSVFEMVKSTSDNSENVEIGKLYA